MMTQANSDEAFIIEWLDSSQAHPPGYYWSMTGAAEWWYCGRRKTYESAVKYVRKLVKESKQTGVGE